MLLIRNEQIRILARHSLADNLLLHAREVAPDVCSGMSPGHLRQVVKGTVACKKKTWFAISIVKLDENKREVPATDITIDLNISDLGDVQRVTAANPKVILTKDLEPGGKGDIKQM